jgi:hypothetical protein
LCERKRGRNDKCVEIISNFVEEETELLNLKN